MKYTVFLLLCTCSSLFAQDYTEQLTKLIELTDHKQYQEAISGYQTLAGDPASPQWLKGASNYEIAELYGAMGNQESALAALEKAIQLDYDDCITPRSERLGALLENPKWGALVGRMKIGEADAKELAWLIAEVSLVEHDATMMITENINRVDQQETVIPQSLIPVRPTNSPGVLYWREQLRLMQEAQRKYVQQSDLQRMEHAAKMQIIAGGSNSADMSESARKATARAESRNLQVKRRALNLPANISNLPKPCSR
jgi:hypothetical protein